MVSLNYNQIVTIFKVSADGYGNNKIMEEYDDVCGIFLASTGYIHANFRENVISDAIFYIDPKNQMVVEHNYRLEGFYILAPLFDIADNEGWYKVTNVTINRDHLLTNQIDNVQLQLKKTRKPYGYS